MINYLASLELLASRDIEVAADFSYIVSPDEYPHRGKSTFNFWNIDLSSACS